MAYDVKAMEAYIRRAAQARGIDPNIAVRVARSEGLASGVWQSRVTGKRGREPSYGPFQLLVGGTGGWSTGMGNDFKRKTGLDPSDPKNVYATVDFALDQAAQNGWGAWYGAKKVGVGNRDGIRGARPIGVSLTSGAPQGYDAIPSPAPNRMVPDGPKGQEVWRNPGVLYPGLPDGPKGRETYPYTPPVPPMPPVPPAGAFPPPPPVPGPLAASPMAGMMGGMQGMMGSLGQIAGAIGGGGDGGRREDVPLQSSLPAFEAADAGRMQAAQSLMTALMGSRKGGNRGLSLMG